MYIHFMIFQNTILVCWPQTHCKQKADNLLHVSKDFLGVDNFVLFRLHCEKTGKRNDLNFLIGNFSVS